MSWKLYYAAVHYVNPILFVFEKIPRNPRKVTRDMTNETIYQRLRIIDDYDHKKNHDFPFHESFFFPFLEYVAVLLVSDLHWWHNNVMMT